jgi:trehalose 6-phosphate synthase
VSPDEQRLLLVTNRAPVTFASRGGSLRVSRGAGGVVTALRHLVRARPVTWVAVAAGEGDLLAARRQRERGLFGSARLTLRLVPLASDLFADYYGQFSNRVLWFVQHGIWRMRIDPESSDRLRSLAARYFAAARTIGETVVREAHRHGHGRLAFVHDYQLYGVPGLVRQRLPGIALSHFVHVPWPELSVWRDGLPDDVIRGLVHSLLGADVIAFQDRRSRSAFVECVETLVPRAHASDEAVAFERRRTLLRVRPISIDPPSLRPRSGAALRSDGRALLVRVDRTDPIKNVPNGFRAFARLLERHPEWVGRVRFIARVVPSRTTIVEYARERDDARRLAAEIVARFGAGTLELVERQDRGRALAELAAADAVLVNSRADGMNLVAKEAAVLNGRLALVLSRSAGAFNELREGALGIDPLDIDQTAEALHAALGMPEEERRTRAAAMRAAVLRWTARDWLRAELDDIAEAESSRLLRTMPAAG